MTTIKCTQYDGWKVRTENHNHKDWGNYCSAHVDIVNPGFANSKVDKHINAGDKEGYYHR